MNEDEEDEGYYSHTHNFSALDYRTTTEPTAEEIEEKRKISEAAEKIAKYEMLYDGMYKLMLAAALRNENLDETYEDLKLWMTFM
ncbi:hypothetical protein V7S76_09755 [Aquirufa sp. ROCK2-A2]